MNQALLEVSPEVLEQAKLVGKYLKLEIRKHRAEGRVEVKYILIAPGGNLDLANLVDEFADLLAWGHASMFNMGGAIIDLD